MFYEILIKHYKLTTLHLIHMHAITEVELARLFLVEAVLSSQLLLRIIVIPFSKEGLLMKLLIKGIRYALS
jgi:hypothetical protein